MSGSIPEVQFDAFGACTWVRFDSDEVESWAGIFGNGPGFSSAAAAVPSHDERHCLVLARSRAYCVDVRARSKVCSIDGLPFVSAIAIQRPASWAVCTYTELLALGSSGISWRSERVALDGIIFESASATVVTGKVWQLEGWYNFRLDVSDMRFERREFVTRDWFEFADSRGPA